MQQRFNKHIAKNFSELHNNPFLIAISGGIDSVVLAHLCQHAKLNFAFAHCNFQLRKEESDQDEKFVKRLAQKIEVKCFIKKFDPKNQVNKDQSIQLAARNLRYKWFAKLLNDTNFNFILTAHHLNDNAETFFINLLRGTGLAGLTGIPNKNKRVLRPLLPFSKKEITTYALQNKLTWREDESNQSDDYLRNRIRHHIIPVFQQEKKDFLNHFQLTQKHLSQNALLIQNYIQQIEEETCSKKQGNIHYSIKKLQKYQPLETVLYHLFHSLGFTNITDINQLLTAQSGKMVFSKTHRLLKDRHHLILSRREKQTNPEISIPKSKKIINFPAGKIIRENVIKVTELQPQIAYLAEQYLEYPLKLRIWESGDRFKPFGMKGTKKISDFLKDQKCSLFEKENTWVLLSGETIVWVVGHRIHNDFKIQENPKNIVKLEWIK